MFILGNSSKFSKSWMRNFVICFWNLKLIFISKNVLQVAPLDMYKEANTGTNLPAQIELYATKGNEYKFLFLAKGGGSANKTFLFQQTKALLNPEKLLMFIDEKIKVNLSELDFLSDLYFSTMEQSRAFNPSNFYLIPLPKCMSS